MKHARDIGLFSNEKEVLAKNVATNEITIFKSVSDCSRHILVSTNGLFKHLNSLVAGRVIKDNYVFKLNDGSEWPRDIFEESDHLTVGRCCDLVVENIVTKEKHIFNTMREACRYLGFPYYLLNNHRARFGPKESYRGWIFNRIIDYTSNGVK